MLLLHIKSRVSPSNLLLCLDPSFTQKAVLPELLDLLPPLLPELLHLPPPSQELLDLPPPDLPLATFYPKTPESRSLDVLERIQSTVPSSSCQQHAAAPVVFTEGVRGSTPPVTASFLNSSRWVSQSLPTSTYHATSSLQGLRTRTTWPSSC